MGIKKNFKRFFDKDDKYFGLFYHLIICFIFVLIGVIIILTFKQFDYVTVANGSNKVEHHIEGIWAKLSSGGAYLAFGLGLLFLYLSIDFLKDTDSFIGVNVLETVGFILVVLSFVCMGYNIIRPIIYIGSNSQYAGNYGPVHGVIGNALDTLTSPANKAKMIFFNPAFPLIFSVAMLSYAATKDNYLGRLIAIAVSIVVSFVITLVAVLTDLLLYIILVYSVLVLIGLLAVLFNVNSAANAWFEGIIAVMFHRPSSGRTSSGGVTGCVRYSADAEKCVINAMNSVKGITTSTSLDYGVKVKFFPDIYVDSGSITITVNYRLSGGEGLTESKLQSVQRQFSSAAERYAENISKRAKECYNKCKSQRNYTLNTQMGSNV